MDIDRFKETVKVVASEAADSNGALETRQKAEAELLTRVIGMAKPVLRAIGTRPQIAYHVAHHADVNYNGGVRTEERYKHRCVPLSDGDFGPEEDCPRANEGTYGGEDLGLREDGVLVQLKYSGGWSRWQGSSWGYEAEITEYADAAEALVAGWTDVDSYIDHLAQTLKGAVGKRKDRVKADLARADRLSAVSKLLNR